MRFSNRIQQMDTTVLRELLALTAKPDIISFAGGLPAPESFPVEALRQASDLVYRLRGRIALPDCRLCGRSWPGGIKVKASIVRRKTSSSSAAPSRDWTWRARCS